MGRLLIFTWIRSSLCPYLFSALVIVTTQHFVPKPLWRYLVFTSTALLKLMKCQTVEISSSKGLISFIAVTIMQEIHLLHLPSLQKSAKYIICLGKPKKLSLHNFALVLLSCLKFSLFCLQRDLLLCSDWDWRQQEKWILQEVTGQCLLWNHHHVLKLIQYSLFSPSYLLQPGGKGARPPEAYCIISSVACFGLFSKVSQPDVSERGKRCSCRFIS